ncbi:MAG: cytochrome c oxidase subunit II [Thermoleophilaceae bacterium]|nr:cytochrome c oxidase subunit II [Thermoleophilaceae bacterium]
MKNSHRIVGLIGVVVAAVVATWASVQIDWFPQLISPIDGKIDSVYTALLISSVPFFVIIVAGIAFILIEFRAKGEDDDRDGEPMHGSTKLEIIWTAIPTIIVIGLGIYSWSVLTDIEAKQPNELKIGVVGQQFAWNFTYENAGAKKIRSHELVVPKGRPLYFSITSVDVIHSFWVPNARVKRDATKGKITPLRFTTDRVGRFPIICTELCGIGHATMRQTLRVVEPSEFKTWVANGGRFAPAKAGDAGKENGAAIFASAGCASCHTLKAANATGKLGPSLEGIGGDPAPELLTSIVKPNARIENGFNKGIMPDNFGQTLSKDDLDALVAYLQQVAK